MLKVIQTHFFQLHMYVSS